MAQRIDLNSEIADLGGTPIAQDLGAEISSLGGSPVSIMDDVPKKVYIPAKKKTLEVPGFFHSGSIGEAARQNFYPELQKGAGEVGKSFIRGWINSAENIGSLVKTFGETITENESISAAVGVGADIVEKNFGKVEESPIFTKFKDGIAKRGDRLIDNFSSLRDNGFSVNGIEFIKADPDTFSGSFVDNPSWTRAASLIAESVPSLLTAYAISQATLNPFAGASALGLLEGAGQREEARDAGLSVDQANAVLAISGIGNTLLEVLPLDFFLKNKGGKVLGALAGASIEGVQESVQTLWSNTIAKYGYDNTRNLFDGMVESLIAGAGSGGILGAFTAQGSSKAKEAVLELKKAGATDAEIGQMIDSVKDQIVENSTKIEEVLDSSAQMLNQDIDIYQQNFEKKSGESLAKKASKYFEDPQKSLNNILTPISTRLGEINPKLKPKIRRFDFDSRQSVLSDEKLVMPFLEQYSKLSERDKSDIDLALKNADTDKISEIAKKNGMAESLAGVKEALSGLYARAKEVGLDIGFLEDYFPRKVKDVEGLFEFFGKSDQWSELNNRLNEKRESLGRDLNEDEKSQVMNSMLRGFGGNQAKLSKPGQLKERKIAEVTPEINKFYKESPESLLDYIYRVNDFIAAKKFFGKSAKGSEFSQQTLENSIGAYVIDLLQSGEISGVQAEEVSDILKARFMPTAVSGFLQDVRNISYLETMGSVTSAITQIQDTAFSLYKNGFYNTGKALSEVISGKAKITKEDIGIERIAEEFSSTRGTAKAVKNVFKWVGLEAMDRVGKETQINAALAKYEALAKDPSPEFLEQMGLIFGEEANAVISEIQNGEVSDNIKFLLFSELADVQPISLSEMPVGYLKGGNARLFYMLKTYTIKQIDVFRTEVFNEIAKGNVEKGLKNLGRLSFFLMIMGASSDILKDLLLGRPLDPNSLFWDNLLKLMGLSKYTIYKFKEDGVLEGFSSIVNVPILKFLTSSGKDLNKALKGEFNPKDTELVQSLPVVGKLYYWWFGGGREKINNPRGRKSSGGANPF